MRIITLGRVTGIGDGDDYTYEGNAHLLRFSIESPDQFFAFQLPFIVETLGIDVRQIMRLELLGDGYTGLQQALVCISFEDAACEAERLESRINKVCAAPSSPNNDFPLCDDVLRQRLINFFLLAPALATARFLKDFAGTIRRKNADSRKPEHETHLSAGLLCRVCFEADTPPSIAEWRNALLCCSERLRRDFVPDWLDRITFTAIPNSEAAYKVEAELLLARCPRIYKERSELRFRSRPIKTTDGILSFEPVSARPELKLKEPEKPPSRNLMNLIHKGVCLCGISIFRSFSRRRSVSSLSVQIAGHMTITKATLSDGVFSTLSSCFH